MIAPAPFHGRVAGGRLPVRAFWLRADDGVRLRIALWQPPVQPPKGTVLLFPGRTEYVEKYAPVADRLAAAGLSTLAIDWRGQGLADRLLPDPDKGHVRNFGDYQRDVRAAMAAAREIGLAEPFHLLAHSMGGCIGLRALHEGLGVRTAVFSAPMWGIRFPPRIAPLAGTIARAGRLFGLGDAYAPGTGPASYILAEATAEANDLTSDGEVFARLVTQLREVRALRLGGPTYRWLDAAIGEMRRLMKMPAPEIPALAAVGGAEAIVAPEAIRARMARWPRGRLLELPGARHELLMERAPIRDAFLTEALRLIEAGDLDAAAGAAIKAPAS